MPSIFDGCPKYLSSNQQSRREDPDSKRLVLENQHLEQAIQDSLKVKEEYDRLYKFQTLEELKECLKNVCIDALWTLAAAEDSIMFVKIVSAPHPMMEKSVVVNKNMEVSAYYGSICLNNVSSFKFPSQINDINNLCDILSHVGNFSICEDTNSSEKDIFSFLNNSFDSLTKIFEKYDDEKKYKQYIDVIKFIKEQVLLLNVNKTRRRYSSDFLILCTLLNHTFKRCH